MSLEARVAELEQQVTDLERKAEEQRHLEAKLRAQARRIGEEMDKKTSELSKLKQELAATKVRKLLWLLFCARCPAPSVTALPVAGVCPAESSVGVLSEGGNWNWAQFAHLTRVCSKRQAKCRLGAATRRLRRRGATGRDWRERCC